MITICLTSGLWAQQLLMRTRAHVSPYSVLVKIVFKTTGFVNMAIMTNCCGGFLASVSLVYEFFQNNKFS